MSSSYADTSPPTPFPKLCPLPAYPAYLLRTFPQRTTPVALATVEQIAADERASTKLNSIFGKWVHIWSCLVALLLVDSHCHLFLVTLKKKKKESQDSLTSSNEPEAA